MKLHWVMLGAIIGATGRYALSGVVAASVRGSFPWGTLLVNLAGCMVIGLAWGYGERAGWSPALRSFLFIGILGSFTTFSSFGMETVNLLRQGETGSAALYVLASNIIGLALVWGGYLSASPSK